MKLQNLLLNKKAAVLQRWFQETIETYPQETSKFLKREKDPFANPVGNTISQGIEGLYDELLRGTDPIEASPFLDQIIRIRAIQDFAPSAAVRFVLSLKKAIREELKDEIRGGQISSDLVAFESRIDELALLSFDIYMGCREKLYELKSNEVKDRTFVLLERANLLSPIPDQEEDSNEGNSDGST